MVVKRTTKVWQQPLADNGNAAMVMVTVMWQQ